MCGCLVTQLSPTLCNPMDCSPPGSSVYGIFQARILEWVAICYSGGSFPLRDWIHVSCVSRQILYHCTTWEVPEGIAFWPCIPTGCLLIKAYSQQCGCWETLLHRSVVFQSALWLNIKFKPKMCLWQGHNCICDEQSRELRWCLFRKKEQTY